jgi:sigma-70-like protein
VPAPPAPAPLPLPAPAPPSLQGVPPIPAAGSSAGRAVRDPIGDLRPDGKAAESRRNRTARRGVAGSGYRKPRRLVRVLRGCLDELSPRSSQLLILRYGIGGARAHPAAEVARRLKLSARRYSVLRRRALRRLVRVSRTTNCRGTGMGVATGLFIASGQALRASQAAAVSVAAEPPATADRREHQGKTRVLGETAKGGDPLGGRQSSSGPSLPLADEAGGTPYVLVAAVLLLAALGWLILRRWHGSDEDSPAS